MNKIIGFHDLNIFANPKSILKNWFVLIHFKKKARKKHKFDKL